MIAAPLIPPERYIDSGALVRGSSAWLISRILNSPAVAKVVTSPPRLVDRAELAATVAAIHQASRAFETSVTALERGNETTAGAVAPQSEWTTKQAADHLRMSQRRVQELAAELGGRKIGRQWLLDEVAVRREHQRRTAA